MNISQRIIELEKGCKGTIYDENYREVERGNCGDEQWKTYEYQDGDHTHKDDYKEIVLCDSCEAKLQLLKEIKEDVLKEMENTYYCPELDHKRVPEVLIFLNKLKQNLIGETK